jgi:SAM-dependent methyltransferase
VGSYRYLLGDARHEAARLRFQARLWDPVAYDLFDRLGVRRGWRVLEVGPGQGSLHVELRRRVRGAVDAVEPSPRFRERVARLSARDGFGDGRIWGDNLAGARLPRAHYDLIFARWVFLFLPDPLRHVRRLAAALRPGGVLAIQDYRRETLSMVPTPADWPAFLAADAAFFLSQGGDVSIGGRLPAIYEKAGLTVTDTRAAIKTGHPGSPVWTWLTTYFMGVMDQLAADPPFDAAAAGRIRRHWQACGRTRTSLLISPAVIDVVGRKRR